MNDINPYEAPVETDFVNQQIVLPNGEYGGLTRLPYFGLGIINAILVGIVAYAVIGNAGLNAATTSVTFVPEALGTV